MKLRRGGSIIACIEGLYGGLKVAVGLSLVSRLGWGVLFEIFLRLV